MVVILCGRWWVDASYAGAAGAGGTTCWNLAGPQRIIAFKPPYFADYDEADSNS